MVVGVGAEVVEMMVRKGRRWCERSVVLGKADSGAKDG